MDGEDFKITVEGVEYRRLEDVPERYRELIRGQLEAARSAASAAADGAAQQAPGSKVRVTKHFEVKMRVKRPGEAPDAGAPRQVVLADSPGWWRLVLLAAAALAGWLLLRRG